MRAEVENAPQPGTPQKKPTASVNSAPPAIESDVDVAAEYEALPPVTPSKPHMPATLAPGSAAGAPAPAPAETPYFTPQGKPAVGAAARPAPSEPKPQRQGDAPTSEQAAPAEGESRGRQSLLAITSRALHNAEARGA